VFVIVGADDFFANFDLLDSGINRSTLADRAARAARNLGDSVGN